MTPLRARFAALARTGLKLALIAPVVFFGVWRLRGVLLGMVLDGRVAGPRYFEIDYLEVPGGGRLRNETWAYEHTGWGGDTRWEGALYYENPETGSSEEVVAPGPDPRSFRRVVSAGVRTGEHVDVAFGHSLYQRIGGAWSAFEMSATDLLPLHYVPIPPDAAASAWRLTVHPTECQPRRPADFQPLRHSVMASCTFPVHEGLSEWKAVGVRFHREGFGMPWTLDKSGTFARSAPARTDSGWPERVRAQLDVYHLTAPGAESRYPSWPRSRADAPGDLVATHQADIVIADLAADALPHSTRIGDYRANLSVLPVATDASGSPVFLWEIRQHGLDYETGQRLSSQLWEEPTLVASERAWIDRRSIPAAFYLTLTPLR